MNLDSLGMANSGLFVCGSVFIIYLLLSFLCVYERENEILRNWLMRVWRLESPKSAGWASSLEIQGRVDLAAQV